MPPHQLIFAFLVERAFHHVGHKLLASSDSPTLASQSAGITGVSHTALTKIIQSDANLLLHIWQISFPTLLLAFECYLWSCGWFVIMFKLLI